MKTKMRFLSYVTFVLFLGLAISSCTKEGPQGPAGQNGTDGADGNANVKTFIFNNPSWENSNSYMILNISELTQDVLDNDAILGYIKINFTSYYSIPGGTPDNFFRVYMDVGQYKIKAEDFDGNDDPTPPNLEKVKVLIIESTNTTTVTGNGRPANPTQAVLEELAAANVDVNDYYAVCKYYGIDPK